jgi:hypothetical protein
MAIILLSIKVRLRHKGRRSVTDRGIPEPVILSPEDSNLGRDEVEVICGRVEVPILDHVLSPPVI